MYAKHQTSFSGDQLVSRRIIPSSFLSNVLECCGTSSSKLGLRLFEIQVYWSEIHFLRSEVLPSIGYDFTGILFLLSLGVASGSSCPSRFSKDQAGRENELIGRSSSPGAHVGDALEPDEGSCDSGSVGSHAQGEPTLAHRRQIATYRGPRPAPS